MVKDKAEKAKVVEDFKPEHVKPFLVKIRCKNCGPQEYRTDNPPKIECPKCHQFEVSEVHVF